MLKRFTLLILLLQAAFLGAQNEQALYHLGSYETGIPESAEVVAFDPTTNQVYFTSAGPNLLTILDLSNPNHPTFVKEIDLSPYGGGPNSVAVYNGMVAVAVEADPKTDPGSVVFFNSNGDWQKTLEVGALPDMIAFNPDGTKVYTANEGEPDDDYMIDPEGSVSVIDVSNGLDNATVTNIGFTAYNDKKAYLQNKGLRIFGNNGQASVAQDLEPEFITFSGDGSQVYVNCQEANGFVVLDGTTNEILDILPLGYKNHYLGSPSLKSYILNDVIPNWPDLGTPVYDGGQPTVKLGGFSGMFYSHMESTIDNYVFYVVPDRGPNGDAVSKGTVTPAPEGNLRPYKLPDYQGRIVKFTYNRRTGILNLVDQIELFQKDGVTPISGKGNIPGFDEVPVTYADPNTAYSSVDYTDANGEEYTVLPYDPLGGDFEGVVRDRDGNLWLCDENRPAIYKFQPNGTLIERYVPEGTSMLGTTPQTPGFYGAETLPSVYSKRRAKSWILKPWLMMQIKT
ncbi:MAG: esterase-like activity of phytase family protein [Saprospiraceae bacterium]